MLKPTVKRDCCWHNVSQYAALGCVRQRSVPADVAGPHTDYEQSLGDAYYDRLSQLIDRHLELATDDRVCYVGDDRGASEVISTLTQHYCLVKPVVRVNPYLV